jgi:hypothetical protein
VVRTGESLAALLTDLIGMSPSEADALVDDFTSTHWSPPRCAILQVS